MAKKPTIQFSTTVYEKDWKLILKTDRLKKMINSYNYTFDQKILFINNVNNFEEVKQQAELLVHQGIIDSYVNVTDYKNKLVNFFKINEENGFPFLGQFLAMIYLSSCDYLLASTGDAIMINDEPWIEQSISKLQKNNSIKIASPSSITNIPDIQSASFDDDEHFYYSYIFSDQCFLLKPKEFRKPIYNEKNDLVLFYPERLRNVSFEERVYKYLRNHKFSIIKHKKSFYLHKNLPTSSKIKTWLCLTLGIGKKKYLL